MPDRPLDLEDPESEPVVDDTTWSQLVDIIGTGPDGIGDLLDTFAESAPDTLDAMQAAAEDGQMEALASTAHKLKGEAGTFGARRLQSICKVLELEARDEQVSDPVARVERVRSLFEETIGELRQRLTTS